MTDQLAHRLHQALDARLDLGPPIPDLRDVVRRGRRRRRVRLAAAATGFVAVVASGIAVPQMDLWSRVGEERALVASGVQRIGRMTVPRAAHAATLLDNGKVLISGGFSGSNEIYYDSAEIFDPMTRIFTPAGVMTSPRTSHASVLLEDGQVLIAGGWGNRFLDSAELYDPATGLFTATAPMSTSRDAFTATRLEDGRVLMVGGFRDGYDSFNRSAEIYDPSSGTFSRVASLRRARAAHSATLLSDGRVVIAGGLGPNGVLRSIEVFDPRTGRFTPGGRLTVGRQKHGATLLDGGKVLLVGGSDIRDFEGRFSSAELYDPAAGSSRPVARMSATRFKVPAPVNLPRSRAVLVVGGGDVADVYRERSRRFVPVEGKLHGAHFFPTATLLDDGTVLVTGGYDEGVNATDGAWVYAP